jgi:hypothetical protein
MLYYSISVCDDFQIVIGMGHAKYSAIPTSSISEYDRRFRSMFCPYALVLQTFMDTPNLTRLISHPVYVIPT